MLRDDSDFIANWYVAKKVVIMMKLKSVLYYNVNTEIVFNCILLY